MGLPVRRLPYLFAQPYTEVPAADAAHPSADAAKPPEAAAKNPELSDSGAVLIRTRAEADEDSRSLCTVANMLFLIALLV
jgi:hypothetical protein